MMMLHRWKLPLVIVAAFAVLGGFFYFQASREALQYASASYLANGHLVNIYTQRGEFRKALALINVMRKEHPEDPAIYYNAAVLYVALGDSNAAVANLQTGFPYATNQDFKDRFSQLLKELTSQ